MTVHDPALAAALRTTGDADRTLASASRRLLASLADGNGKTDWCSFSGATGLASLLDALQRPGRQSPPETPDLAGAVAAAHAQGWHAGHDAGRAEAEAQLAPLIAALEAAADALQAACQVEPDSLRPLLTTLVRSLAKAVLAAELKSGAEVLMPLVDLALAQVRPDEAPVLMAHPETLAALAGQLPAGLATAPDAAMARDEFAVHGPDFAIAAGLDARLAVAMEALL